jgi:hypothetical protein
MAFPDFFGLPSRIEVRVENAAVYNRPLVYLGLSRKRPVSGGWGRK